MAYRKQRVILHCDLNNFYASVACLDNPSIKNFPVAVAGSAENRHGIILAKNYVAKQFDIKTGEPIHKAESKCPNIILVPPNFKRQAELSKKVQNIYLRYTDTVEPFGVDECWLDMTAGISFGDAERVANEIRETVKKEIGLTISVGVSFNKIFAKLGSDMKKPDAVTVISRENFKDKVWPLPVSDLFGVGRSTAERLKSIGVFTIGDLAIISKSALKRVFGKNGITICAFANGEDNGEVLTFKSLPSPKSVGRSITAPRDITTLDEAWRIFLYQSEEIALQLKKYSQSASAVQVHTRTYDLVVRDFEGSLERPTDLSAVIARRGIELLVENGGITKPLRSLGIRAIRLDTEKQFQQGIFDDAEDIKKCQITDEELFAIRARFGYDSIFRARLTDVDRPQTISHFGTKR